MPSTGPDTVRLRRTTWAALLIGLLAPALVSCTGDPEPTLPAAPGASPLAVAPLAEDLLAQRAKAVRLGDREAFEATLDVTDDAFAASEVAYFDNLAQLPIAAFSYALDPASVVRRGAGFDAVVEVAVRLKGYDDRPVVRPRRFHFVRDETGTGLLVASRRDRAWEQRNGIAVQPWESGPVTVVERDGVLAIFDRRSRHRADEVMSVVARSRDQVAAIVPYAWSGNVVVYALSDTDALESLDVPGEDPAVLDAVAFAIPAETPLGEESADGPIASTRFLLHPRMLRTERLPLARLVRHELTHVALGQRDDNAPTWLGEGIAEWVSVQPLVKTDRLISQAAIDAARAEPEALPADLDFHGSDQTANYGLSWWACEAIVELRGERMLWRLLDELAPLAPGDQDDQLQQVLQMGNGQVAREAARRILATYA